MGTDFFHLIVYLKDISFIIGMAVYGGDWCHIPVMHSLRYHRVQRG